METIDKVKQGKRNKRMGSLHEKLVRSELERDGWNVTRYGNVVKNGAIMPCGHKFNPFTKSVMNINSGMPDFLCYKVKDSLESKNWTVIGVEAKRGKYLDKNEKEMALFYLKNNIFDEFQVAYLNDKGFIAFDKITIEKIENSMRKDLKFRCKHCHEERKVSQRSEIGSVCIFCEDDYNSRFKED